MEVNVTKEKKLTNNALFLGRRSHSPDPHRQLSLEQAIEFIADDEFVEITPKSIRLRKKVLQYSKRAAPLAGNPRQPGSRELEVFRQLTQALTATELVPSAVGSVNPASFARVGATSRYQSGTRFFPRATPGPPGKKAARKSEDPATLQRAACLTEETTGPLNAEPVRHRFQPDKNEAFG